MADQGKFLPNEVAGQIDFKPNPKFLDRRGEWADRLMGAFSLSEWNINQNTVRVSDAENKTCMILTYKRCWLSITDCPDRGTLPNSFQTFTNLIFSESTEFGPAATVTRIGVRSRFLTKQEKPFGAVVDKFRANFINIAPGALEAIAEHASVLDIATPYDLNLPLGKAHLTCGPMKQSEAKGNWFKNRPESELPETGLYFDLDYYKEFGDGESPLRRDEMADLIKRLATDSWNAHARVRQKITS